MRRRGLGRPWEGAREPVEEPFHGCAELSIRLPLLLLELAPGGHTGWERLAAPRQRGAVGKELQAPWIGKTCELGEVKPGLFVSPGANSGYSWNNEQARHYQLLKY